MSSLLINTFFQNPDNVSTYVLNIEYQILESNQDHKGNFEDILLKEDIIKFKKHITKNLTSDLYIHLPENHFHQPKKCNIWKKHNHIYIIAQKAKPEDYYKDSSLKLSNYTEVSIIDTSFKIIETDCKKHNIGDNYIESISSNIKHRFTTAINFCIKHKSISGIEHNIDNKFSGSILYRFIPKKKDDGLIITIIKQTLDFKNFGDYSENYFQDIIDNSADFIYKNDPSGHFIYVNDTAKKQFNFSEKKENHHFTDFIRPDYKDLVSKFYTTQVEQKLETTYLEFPTIDANNEILWIGQNVRMVFSGDFVLGIQTTARDITENKIIEHELMEIQSKNQAILDTIPDSIFLFDKDLKLLDSKTEIDSNLFEINIEDHISKCHLDILDIKEITKLVQQSLEEQTLKKIELKNTISGEQQTYETNIAPIDENQVLILAKNITNRVQQQNKLQSLQEKEREALDAKQRYLSFMTHEIRTPLNAIIGLNDLIFDTNPTPKQMEYLKNIRSSGSILSKIINDVLDFNKLENNKIELDPVNFSLSKVFNDVIRTCNVNILQKAIELKHEIDSSIPKAIKGDSAKLTQVLTNLTSNALKFTQEGNVTVKAKLIEIDDDSVKIKFSVSDTGIGIAEDKVNKVFNSYEQIDASINRKYGGTGLGLTISQKFVELMGGKIDIKSKLNKGSEFSFTIVFEASTGLPKVEKAPVQVDLSSFHILLVEDNEMNQLVMGKYLKKWGVSYDIAENGLEAIEKIEETEYHLVFLDLEMPVMDGFETAKIIRAHKNKAISEMIIIALSASVFSEVEQRTKAIGFNDFIGKPINSNYVYLKITEYLLDQVVIEDEEEEKSTNIPLGQSTSFDLSYLLESSLNDSNYVHKMIELFLSKTPTYIKNLFELLEQGQYKELKKLAHKFKASVAIMGVRDAENAIHKLESNIAENKNLEDSKQLLAQIKKASLTACDEISIKLKNNTLF